MTLILIFSDARVEVFSAINAEDARYWFNRRIEKEGAVAERAFLVPDSSELPVSEWEAEYFVEEARQLKQATEEAEKRQYEMLKAKFEKLEGKNE